jgi:hypothetical protein
MIDRKGMHRSREGETPMRIVFPALAILAFALAGCESASRAGEDTDDHGTGVDDAGGDSDSDADSDTDSDGDGDGCPPNSESYIWISNTGSPDAGLPDEGTLSKVDTRTGIEVARYVTSQQGPDGDPSRTSVNLHGDMVVTNRSPASGPSSVTKFAGDIADCVDKDSDGDIETSTGPDDVKPWGEDECMLWNTKLPGLVGANSACGARATAWDGEEDPDTGKGGHVWIGTVDTSKIFKLDGDTGKILETVKSPVPAYGGAVDGKGGFWVVSMLCTVGACTIGRVDMTSLTSKSYPVKCGYGISVDAAGRVWTAGLGCISRLDPSTDPPTKDSVVVAGFNRGVAVDNNGSVWAAGTAGNLVQVDQDTMKVKHNKGLGKSAMVGVAIDCDGYVWVVSQGGSEAYRVDPVTYQKTTVTIGPLPYTYSDMTGMQLRNVVPVE